MSEAPEKPSILCVGRLYCDLIFTDLPRMPTLGTEVFAGSLGIHPGGGAPITAAHLTALGHKAYLAATAPAPPFGQSVMERLDEAGVDLAFCARPPEGAAPQLTVALVHGAERSFVSHRVGAAAPRLSVDEIKQRGIAHIHVGEAATLLESPDLMQTARDAGVTTSLDCSWDDDLDTNLLASLLPSIDVFLPNEAEAEMLKAQGLTEPSCKLTIMKQGAQGATAISGERQIHIAALPTNVVDTTGAGDAFNAGFLASWIRGDALADCLKNGVAAGSAATTYCGGFQVPS